MSTVQTGFYDQVDQVVPGPLSSDHPILHGLIRPKLAAREVPGATRRPAAEQVLENRATDLKVI
jgi:hypothetical protein